MPTLARQGVNRRAGGFFRCRRHPVVGLANGQVIHIALLSAFLEGFGRERHSCITDNAGLKTGGRRRRRVMEVPEIVPLMTHGLKDVPVMSLWGC